MPLMLIKAAHLQLCKKCKTHGRIICSDGSKSEEFLTKSQALKEVDALCESGKILPEEATVLADAIEKSQLPRDEHELLRLLLPTGLRFASEAEIEAAFDIGEDDESPRCSNEGSEAVH